MFNLDLEKAEEPEIKLPTSAGSWKKQESSRKTSALLTMSKPLTVWITTNCRKFFRRWEYQTTWPASWEICMQVKKQQLELDMEQQTGSKLGKEYIKVVYCQCDLRRVERDPENLQSRTVGVLQALSWEDPSWSLSTCNNGSWGISEASLDTPLLGTLLQPLWTHPFKPCPWAFTPDRKGAWFLGLRLKQLDLGFYTKSSDHRA